MLVNSWNKMCLYGKKLLYGTSPFLELSWNECILNIDEPRESKWNLFSNLCDVVLPNGHDCYFEFSASLLHYSFLLTTRLFGDFFTYSLLFLIIFSLITTKMIKIII